jgi:hypothetical protein
MHFFPLVLIHVTHGLRNCSDPKLESCDILPTKPEVSLNSSPANLNLQLAMNTQSDPFQLQAFEMPDFSSFDASEFDPSAGIQFQGASTSLPDLHLPNGGADASADGSADGSGKRKVYVSPYSSIPVSLGDIPEFSTSNLDIMKMSGRFPALDKLKRGGPFLNALKNLLRGG